MAGEPQPDTGNNRLYLHAHSSGATIVTIDKQWMNADPDDANDNAGDKFTSSGTGPFRDTWRLDPELDHNLYLNPNEDVVIWYYISSTSATGGQSEATVIATLSYDDVLIGEDSDTKAMGGSTGFRLTFKSSNQKIPNGANLVLKTEINIGGGCSVEYGKSYVDLPIVSRRYGVDLSATSTSKGGSPGTTAILPFTATNTGNDADSFSVSVSGSGGGWTASVSESSFSLSAGSKRAGQLTVGVPSDASHGDSRQFTVTATSQGSPTATDSMTFTVEVGKVTKLVLELQTAGRLGVKARESCAFMFNLRNSGNSQETVTLNVAGPGSEWCSLSKYAATIPAGGVETITLTAQPPKGTDSGNYAIAVMATPSSDASAAVQQSVSVEVKGGITSMIPGFETVGLLGAILVVITLQMTMKKRKR